jgi:hypothetical protein
MSVESIEPMFHNYAVKTLPVLRNHAAIWIVGLATIANCCYPNPVWALSPIQSWRQLNFGTTNNLGDAADDAEVDGDGLVNLVEYALNLNPKLPSVSPVTADISSGHLRMAVPKNTNAFDVAFIVETSTNLLAFGSWTTNGTIVDQDSSSLLQVHDNALVESGMEFMRLRIVNRNLTEPGIPLSLLTIPGAARVTLNWTAPTNSGGEPIDAYSIQTFFNGQLVASNSTLAHR